MNYCTKKNSKNCRKVNYCTKKNREIGKIRGKTHIYFGTKNHFGVFILVQKIGFWWFWRIILVQKIGFWAFLNYCTKKNRGDFGVWEVICINYS